MVCRGCGKNMQHPFPAGQLTFKYRAAEPLLRVLEHDALVHLLALRYFCRLLAPSFDRPSLIYGGYPGVDFYDLDTGEALGEADVAFLLADGSLIVGECKRRGMGLNGAEVSKLEALGARVGSPWTFLATTDLAGRCPKIWPRSQRALPNAPRFVLSAEQLFEPHIFWPLGTNPLEWHELAEAEHDTREARFSEGLSRAVAWLSGEHGQDEQRMAEADVRAAEQRGDSPGG
jgi:hypothetical protein